MQFWACNSGDTIHNYSVVPYKFRVVPVSWDEGLTGKSQDQRREQNGKANNYVLCPRNSKKLERKTGFNVYFADPYSSWQRGTNENTNGLLRQYFPKGCDLSRVTDQMLAEAVRKLNHRPRKCLGYRTPHEVFNSARSGAL